MIKKIYQSKDVNLNRQFDEIMSNQFANQKEVSLTVVATGVTYKVDIGFLADRAIPVAGYIGMQIEIVSSDNRYMYLKSNAGTGTIVLKVWKSQ